MKKIFFAFLFIFTFNLINLFPNELAVNFNSNINSLDFSNNSINNNFFFSFSHNHQIKDIDLILYEEKEKINIFDKPDMSWIKEKNRMDKLFIAIGVVSFTIGFSMFLAGLLMLVIPNDAVKIDGVWITNVENTYIAVTSVGGGLMAAGIPFILVGSIRLGLAKKAEKQKAKESEENQNE